MDPTPHPSPYAYSSSSRPIGPAPKLVPALLGGLFIGVLSALPFVSSANCCCLWVITGGMLAAWLVQQNHPLPITVGEGAVVGLLAGLVGGLVAYGLSIPIGMLIEPIAGGFNQDIMRTSRRDMPPEVRQVLDRVGPQWMFFLSSLIWAAVSLFVGTFGGILGAVFFRKVLPPAPPPVPPPPPPQSWTPPGI